MQRSQHAFVNQMLICFLVCIAAGGSVGMGTVWLRNQISVVANTNRQLTAKIDDLNRRATELSSQIETEQRLDVLRRRNDQWRLGLVPVSDGQVIHVADNTVERMVRRANQNLFRVSFEVKRNEPAAPFRVAWQR
jgi:hypothetical protein